MTYPNGMTAPVYGYRCEEPVVDAYSEACAGHSTGWAINPPARPAVAPLDLELQA
jgi:hypothetical protein